MAEEGAKLTSFYASPVVPQPFSCGHPVRCLSLPPPGSPPGAWRYPP
jgi:hypothetical protein